MLTVESRDEAVEPRSTADSSETMRPCASTIRNVGDTGIQKDGSVDSTDLSSQPPEGQSSSWLKPRTVN
jgi:hypothetical protein